MKWPCDDTINVLKTTWTAKMTTMTINTTAPVSTTATDGKIELQQAIWKQLKALARKISIAYTVYDERRALAKLSNDMLDDMGLTRAEINKECNRSILDVPTNRK